MCVKEIVHHIKKREPPLSGILFPCAGDRDRTGTGITTHGILSPGRLPVPPRRRFWHFNTDCRRISSDAEKSPGFKCFKSCRLRQKTKNTPETAGSPTVSGVLYAKNVCYSASSSPSSSMRSANSASASAERSASSRAACALSSGKSCGSTCCSSSGRSAGPYGCACSSKSCAS